MKNNFIFSVLFTLILVFTVTSCAKTIETNTVDNTEIEKTEDSKEKITIVTTVFPIYDWTKEIIGENNEDVELIMLLNSGVDLHSFQPSVNDVITISNCDVFIYIGGESELWVNDVLKEAKNPNMRVINLLDVLGDQAKTEELIEGMEDEEHGEHDEDEEHDEESYDEHIWLSLKNTVLFVEEISFVISDIDKNNSNIYLENTKSYVEKLNELDDRYKIMIENTNNDTLIFGDRFPFRYLVDDYNLSYYAPFLGCSTETNASFETIVFLANKLEELSLNYIIALENSSSKISKTVIDNTKDKNQEILEMDSMQSTSMSDSENGTTYLTIMEKNLETLKKALE